MDINDAKAIKEKLVETEERLMQAEGSLFDRNPEAAAFFIREALKTLRAEQKKLNEEE